MDITTPNTTIVDLYVDFQCLAELTVLYRPGRGKGIKHFFLQYITRYNTYHVYIAVWNSIYFSPNTDLSFEQCYLILSSG